MSLEYVPALSEAQAAQVLADSHALWGGGRTLAERTERTLGLMRDSPDLLRMSGLVEDGRVLASLKRYSVALTCGEAAGFGAVFTVEDRRRQGLAERLIKVELEDGAPALLFSDIGTAFYEKLGFRALPALIGRAATADLPGTGALETRAAAPADAPRLRAWFEASFAPGLLRPARDARRWDFFRRLNQGGPDLVLAERGYLSVAFAKDELWVEEWAAPGVDPARVWATARRLAEERGLSRVGAWLDAAPPGFTLAPRAKAVPMLARAGSGPAWLGSLDHF